MKKRTDQSGTPEPRKKKEPAAALNMAREYRDELKTLRKHERKIERDFKTFVRQTKKAVDKLQRDRDRAMTNGLREVARIHKRRQILEGRLS